MGLIGSMCKFSNEFSRGVLIDHCFYINRKNFGCFIVSLFSHFVVGDRKGILIILYLKFKFFGAFSDEVIPVPIPNTEVKLISADDTA